MKTDFLKEQMDTLLAQRAFTDDFVLPDYEKLNVKNLSSLIKKIYGLNSAGLSGLPSYSVDDFGGVNNVVLVVLDGLGFNRLSKHLNDHDGLFAELAQKGVLKAATTTFPSTTATVLTSIFTGLSPAEHGIIGFQMFSRKYGVVFSTLDMKQVYGHSRQVNIAEDFSEKIDPWMSSLENAGVRTLIAMPASIAYDGLSRVTYRNQAIIPRRMLSDMLVQSGKVLDQTEKTFLVMYYSGIDNLEHKYGPYTQEVSLEIENLECSFKNFINKIPDQTKKQTLMIFTADHGVAETRRTYYIKDMPEVNSRLMLPPVGDGRATFLYSYPGQSEALANAFRKDVGDFKLFKSSDLIKAGAFGQTGNEAALRQIVGDFSALATGKSTLQYPFYEEDRDSEMLGSHGGLTAEEMIVPVLSIRLSKL